MQRVRVAIIGAGAATEWGVLPVLSGPDSVAPPDSGAWWSRRPAAGGEIRYQPPARPEVVALSDSDPKRAADVARAARVAGVYSDWRQMVREVAPDAVFWPLEDPFSNASKAENQPTAMEVVKAVAASGARWLWREGPPARSLAELDLLGQALAGRNVHFWPAVPLRLAAAHRAARRLIERDAIGPVCSLQARWPVAFEGNWGAVYEAFDLMLSFLPATAGSAQIVMGGEQSGAASFWVQMSGGLTFTLLFSAADAWNAPLPRLELVGTQGRFLVCEGGRRVGLFVPREAARWWEPPGLASHLSAPGVAGVAEDIKAFLAASVGTAPLVGAETVLGEPGRALAVCEAAAAALASGEPQEVAARTAGAALPASAEPSLVPSRAPRGGENLTLELG